MPGTRCAVFVCNNSLQETKTSDSYISYHKFPKNAKIQKLWIDACGRKGAWNHKTSVVCSDHFNENDFITDLRESLMGVKTKRTLKPSAIPSRNCTRENNKLITRTRSKRTRKKRTKTNTVETRFTQTEAAGPSDMEHEIHNCEVSQEQLESIYEKYTMLQNKYQRLEQSYNEQQEKMNTLEKQWFEMSSKDDEQLQE